MNLPVEIHETFLDTLSGDKTILEFEEWLYTDKTLEFLLTGDDYLELISFGYKALNPKYDLFEILKKHVDLGELEKRRIKKLLVKVLNKDEELSDVLIIFYDLYCDGYGFLQNLGLNYGLTIECPFPKADTWDELSIDEHQELLNSFYPEIEEEVKKVIFWLDNDIVILTGIKQENNHFVYTDRRTEEERKWTAYKKSTSEDQPTISKKSHSDNNLKRRWWKFWDK